jgi:hypothetical protein
VGFSKACPNTAKAGNEDAGLCLGPVSTRTDSPTRISRSV